MSSACKLFSKNFWKAILWGCLVFLLCLWKKDALPESSFFDKIPFFDKIVHFGLYFLFTLFLLSGFFQQKGKSSVNTYVYSAVIALSYGILIEFLQPYTGRSFELLDILTNSLGIIAAMALFRPVKKRFGRIII